MPQATDLILKNAAAADKTFSLITPAAGDGGIAEWALKEGAISSVFPRITASAHKTPRSRILTEKYRFPSSYVDSITGLTNVGPSAEVHVKVVMPHDYPESQKDNVVAYSSNAGANALIKSMRREAVGAN